MVENTIAVLQHQSQQQKRYVWTKTATHCTETTYGYDPAVPKLRLGFRARLSGLFTQIRVQRKGWNEREAWSAADISNTTLTGIESPDGNPKIDSLSRYARALGYELEDFLAAAAHPESEDAFGHPDVQKFIRVWKRLGPDERAGLMNAVSGYERLSRP